ncbi:MAG: transcriptional regulator with XRE-family HTH domain [Kiritimatiellia bacterium]
MNIIALGKVVKDRRRLLDVKQADLARISKISVHALSDIESGKGNPTLETLQQVLEALGLALHVEIKKADGIDA